MVIAEHKKKTQAFKIENGLRHDAEIERNDFAAAHSLDDLHRQLQTFDNELANLIEWIKEEFSGDLHEIACRQLQVAREALQKLNKLVGK